MAVNTQAVEHLLNRLAAGWRESDRHAPEELVHLWGNALHANVRVEAVADNAAPFRTDLSNVRLAGMGDVPCLLLGGNGPPVTAALSRLGQTAGMESTIPFVLCVSDAAYVEASSVLPSDRALRLARRQVGDVITDAIPMDALKRTLRRSIPMLRLIPYTITRPVTGSMFFGRKDELDILQYQEEANVVVAGPGRAGKTSLLHEFKRRVSSSKEHREIVYVDCYPHATSDDFVRHLAMTLQPGRKGYRTTTSDLPGFLQYAVPRLRGPVELILDEVDALCEHEASTGYHAFKSLRAACGRRFTRVIFGGRRIALRVSGDANMPFHDRLRLMRLGALDEASAVELIMAPFQDLGIVPDCIGLLLEHVLRMSGRFPNLLQWYGMELATLAAQDQDAVIQMHDLERLEERFETVQHFNGAFNDISDAKERMAALLLTQLQVSRASVPAIVGILSQAGLQFDGGSEHRDVRELCDDLVIRNILAWHHESFSLANRALWHFGNHAGFLDSMLQDCRKQLGLGAPPPASISSDGSMSLEGKDR